MSNALPRTVFVFIRHAQTMWNGEHRYAGSSEVALAPEAKEQIAELTDKLGNCGIDVFYSSPLTRCLETVSPLAAHHKKRIIVREDLKERNLGEWEGKTPEEIGVPAGFHFPDSAYNGDYRVPGAETLEHLEQRLRHFMQEAHESHPGQTIAVATHGGLIWSLHDHIVSNRPATVTWPGNCAVYYVVSEGNHFLLLPPL